MPVHYNTHTKEPYLRLPSPLTNIIITPHRLSQLEETVDAQVRLLNEPIIYLNLEGPPVPYLREHGEAWVKTRCEAGEPVLRALRAELETSVQEHQFFDLCPFTVIREVTEQDPETGHPLKDVLIGDVGMSRYSFYEYGYGTEKRAEAQRANAELPAGDARIVWGIGGASIIGGTVIGDTEHPLQISCLLLTTAGGS
jgi:hypothetical protein